MERELGMKVQTEQFGEVELAEERVITFDRGIPGFDEYKKYVLLPADAEGESPFFFLQSVDAVEVSFFLVDPFTFFQDYDINLDEQMVERLQLEDSSDAIVLTTVTVKGDISGATTNLKAPLVINNKTKTGLQVVLNNKDYQIKQALFQSGDTAARQV